jgi:RNA polymerase sigma-54 factor
MLKPSLQLRLGQQLTLTPQLRQAIRLLQMSSLELETEVRSVLESNPLLELDENETSAEGSAELLDERDIGEALLRDDSNLPQPEVAPAASFDASDDSSSNSPDNDTLTDSPLDYEPDWDVEPSMGNGTGAGSHDEDRGDSQQDAASETLLDHLLWQLNLTPMSARDHAIALALIDAIGEDGYLSETIDAIRDGLAPEVDADVDEVETVLHRIQRFDPLGVAARSLSECLWVQLTEQDSSHPALALAMTLAKHHLEALAKLGNDKLAQQLGVTKTEMNAAVTLLRSLDPRPGAQISSAAVEYVTPDAFALRHQGGWRVQLASACLPRLGINRHYESLIGHASRSDSSYLRGQLQEARWLIKSLETRADTVLRVAQCIVRHQTGFLDHGPEAMRPLVLREIAEELELHESTISRVTTRKYLHTPRGTFEFKHFFSSGVATIDGGGASSTAIQAMIKRMIDAEDPRKPLSDARLTAELKSQGITLARRTVAKYREAMNVPSSNERQRVS